MKILPAIQKRFMLLVLLAGMGALKGGAQPEHPVGKQLFFKRISTLEGLPQPSVNSILRDSRGFVWVATEDGLSRFDGTEFKTFRHDPDDSTSLSHNVVHFVQEDQKTGNLWVGTVSGMNYFDRSLERFQVFKTDDTPGIVYTDAALDKKNGRLWLACTVGGLQYLDLSLQKVIAFKEHSLNKEIVWTVAVTSDSLVIGTREGLKILNLQSHQITTINNKASVRSLLIDPDNIWFGTEGYGLGQLNRATKQITYFHQKNGGTINDNIWSLAKDKDQNLWIGTDGGGLNILTPDHKHYDYLHSEFDERSLSSNTIRSIFIEPNGNVWLGTYNGGLNYYEVPPVRFQLYKNEYLSEHSLKHNAVSAFAEANDGTVWVGTDGGGLHYLKDETVYRYMFPNGLKHVNVITALLADGNGLWVGTYQNGLVYLNGHGGWKQYLHDARNKNSIGNNTVWSVQKDSLGHLWVGTDRGVNRFAPETGIFHHLDNPLAGPISQLFADLPAQTIFISSANTLWVGSYGMLTAYIPSIDTVLKINDADRKGRTISDLRVKTILEDNEKIWIGTYGSGLCQYNTATGKFYIFDERDGVPDNTVLGIERDKPGSLWLSTNEGLTHFNEADTTFTLFGSCYGVQGTIFNRNASLETRDGRLLFGGTRGFNVFKPREFQHTPDSLTIVFTDFHIFNKQIKPGSKLLASSITETREIDLSHADSRLITIQFSAFNFLSQDKVIYHYKLEGFNSDWQKAGKDHGVTFTNLDPGTYRLFVRASLNGKTWGPQKTLDIIIQTLWWKTSYFRFAAFILFCLTGFAFFRYRTYNLKVRKQELEDLVNQQSREIKRQNEDLAAQNEELKAQNEEMGAQQETIIGQNLMLAEAQKTLQTINESLEQTVQHRTEKLNDTIVQLNKTIKELDAFVYSASHDLIAPLKSVMGLIDLMRRQNKQADLVCYVDFTEQSIKKLENVIKNMIQYSQNSSLDIVYKEVNLYALVEECLSGLKFFPSMEAMHVEIAFAKDLTVKSDHKRVSMILSNLINNAVKYRDATKDKSQIKISVEQGKNAWKLNIEDNGIGIAKPFLSRIFEMFYRATDRSQGSGLGLYIVKETVDRLYGEIYVDSEEGQWTRFTVAIPNERMYLRKK